MIFDVVPMPLAFFILLGAEIVLVVHKTITDEGIFDVWTQKLLVTNCAATFLSKALPRVMPVSYMFVTM